MKVIAGFWVNFLNFDANNNISSTDNNGNVLSRQDIINNFVNYVNTFKGNRAVLFWAIGNENNYEVLNASTVSIKPFEGAFGLSYGDSIYNWLEQKGNILDFDGNILVDLMSPAVTNLLMGQYPADYNSILSILRQFSGQALTPQQLTAWYSLVDAMAQAAHIAEGAFFHPVALVNGEIFNIGNSADGTTDSQMPDLDIWGANVYRGESFGTLFSNYASQSSKPLWISEFGIDAWSVTNATGINNWGLTLSADLGGTGTYDPATQSTWDGNLWNEILNNSPVTIGGSVMEYSDEWWKPYEFYCTNPNDSQYDNSISAGICNSNKKYFGNPFSAFPDSFMNQDWFGAMAISPNPVTGGPDIMAPRADYSNLQALWQANPWPTLTLNITGTGMGTISGPSSLGAGLDCNYSSGSSTGNCLANYTKNQPVTLSFLSGNGSTITNWGVIGCAGGSTTCNITPDTNINLNVTVSAPIITPAVAITSPINPNYIVAGTDVSITASATETGGTISSVAFYNGTSLLGTAINSPYAYLWKGVPGGYYNITAVATDGAGTKSVSTPLSIVSTAASPIVSIATPVSRSTFTAGSTISITAYAAENYGGTISKVAFYNGTTLLGTQSIGFYGAYTYTWANVPGGAYSITAVATDSIGTSTTSSPVSVTVASPASSPVVAITSPINPNYIVAGTDVSITASATETGGTISSVAFYNGTSLLGTAINSPYAYLWKGVPGGYYNITAVATDGAGTKSVSTPLSIVSTAASPIVSIATPVSRSTFTAGSTISITAYAAENYGGTISKVAFYNGTTLLGTQSIGFYGAYTYTWANVPGGAYSITAVATDSIGTSTTSSPVSVTVASPASSPVVAITSPINPNYIVAGTDVSITASATETGGTISSVAFYNGTSLLGTAINSPYAYLWKGVPGGYYNITAVATDGAGTKSVSTPLSIVSTAASPIVSIATPVSRSTFTAGSTISITAYAAENYGGTISKVAFYNGTTLLGTQSIGFYGAYTYTWANVPGGAYSITAVATDSIGTSTTSSPVSVTVASPASSPVVAITSPINPNYIVAGTDIQPKQRRQSQTERLIRFLLTPVQND